MSVANILTAADSGFESGITNWLPGGFTQLASSSAQAHTGTKSMLLTCLSNGPSSAILNPLLPVLPGVIINPSAYFYSNNTGTTTTGAFNLVWFASDKITIVGTTSNSGAGQTLATTTWTQASMIGAQAPANAFWVQIQAVVGNNSTINSVWIDDVALGWGNYATNMCPNPSFETDLTGWSGTRGDEVLTQVNTYDNSAYQFGIGQDQQPHYLRIYAGNSALQVSTPGLQQNEGVYGPSTWMPVTTTGSMSCNLYGETGTVVVQAVDQITGSILGQQIVTFAGGTNWYNAQIPNLTFVAGHTYYMQVITYGPPQTLVFMVDGVMYQPEAPVTPYVDGDQINCFWTGTIGESVSYQPFQFGISAKCKFLIGGAANIINPNVTVVAQVTQVLEFFITFGPPSPTGVVMTVSSPSAAMTDFGIWQGGALGTDLDPAMAYSTWNTQDIMSAVIGYNRPYMAVTPSLDVFNSTGGYTWKRTGYIALGFQWLNVTNGNTQIITDIQTELLPINQFNALTPRPYQQARQLQTIVKPDRLNYITNPSFEVSTANWSQIGSGQVLSTSASVPTIPGIVFSPGIKSMAVNVTSAAGVGVQITVNYLIPGRIYMASMWLLPDGNSIGDIQGTCGSSTVTLTGVLGTGYGVGGFGSGPYGGMTLNTQPLPNTWQQLFFSFQATSDSHILSVEPIPTAAPTYPYTWNIDAVVVEDGDILNPYFDGNFGVDALWLDGGTPGLCQSFYYNQLEFARHIIVDSLNNNTPLGISYATPQYAVMPTQ